MKWIIIMLLFIAALTVAGSVLFEIAHGETLEDWNEVSERLDMASLTPEERAYVMGPAYGWQVDRAYQLILENGSVDLRTLEICYEC